VARTRLIDLDIIDEFFYDSERIVNEPQRS